MSNLDRSLDEILSARKASSRGRGRGRKVPIGSRKVPTAPAGGIRKATKDTGKTGGKVPLSSGPSSGDSKIIVSNLVSAFAIHCMMCPCLTKCKAP